LLRGWWSKYKISDFFFSNKFRISGISGLLNAMSVMIIFLASVCFKSCASETGFVKKIPASGNLESETAPAHIPSVSAWVRITVSCIYLICKKENKSLRRERDFRKLHIFVLNCLEPPSPYGHTLSIFA